jgi:hypothetical protein
LKGLDNAETAGREENERSAGCLVETKALELLKKVYAHFEAKHNTFNNDAPGHAHYKKGLWDKDGERCGWCATWEEVRAHINAEYGRTEVRGSADSLVGPCDCCKCDPCACDENKHDGDVI